MLKRSKSKRKYWSVVLVNGVTRNVPSDKPRNENEHFRKNPTIAVVERISRTQEAHRIVSNGLAPDVKHVIKTIISPAGIATHLIQ